MRDGDEKSLPAQMITLVFTSKHGHLSWRTSSWRHRINDYRVQHQHLAPVNVPRPISACSHLSYYRTSLLPLISTPYKPSPPSHTIHTQHHTMLVSTLISLALSTLPATLAQGPAPPLSLCEEYFPGTRDACCDSLISRGASAPCAALELVSNVTDCTMDKSPTGWACCVELVRLLLIARA